MCPGLRYSILSRRRNAHEVLVQVATCNNAAAAQAEPVAELGAGIGAQLGTFAQGTAQIFVSYAEFKAKSNYTRQTKLSLVISMKRGEGERE